MRRLLLTADRIVIMTAYGTGSELKNCFVKCLCAAKLRAKGPSGCQRDCGGVWHMPHLSLSLSLSAQHTHSDYGQNLCACCALSLERCRLLHYIILSVTTVSPKRQRTCRAVTEKTKGLHTAGSQYSLHNPVLYCSGDYSISKYLSQPVDQM